MISKTSGGKTKRSDTSATSDQPKRSVTPATSDQPKRGGKRPGAGRKRRRELRYDPSHAVRPELSFEHPVHTMLRTLPHMPRLRQRAGYEAIRAAARCDPRSNCRC